MLNKFLNFFRSQQAPNGTPLEAIVTTVQFLPQRLARMFEQAEKYARETILPLVSTYTPRFISEFIGPREEPKYVPLHYDEDEIQQTSSSKRIATESGARSRNLLLPVQEEKTTTPYTHIQRITKKTELTPASNLLPESTSKRSERKDLSRKTRDHGAIGLGDGNAKKEIFINLPVFDNDVVKYIPIGEAS